MGTNTLLLSAVGLAFFFLVLSRLRFFRRVWWHTISVKKAMEAQGIRGPPYRFLHGSTKEAAVMLRESMSRSMELSHDILPKVQPHLHAWIKIYGRNMLMWHGPKPTLMIGEPELIKEMLNNPDGAFPKAPPLGYVKKLLGDGLVTSEGRKWAKCRKLANHAFHAESLKMTMIINESLRLYPPVALISREGAREVRLGKFILPAGMEVALSPLAVHHDPNIWGEDAHLFRPERFSEGVAGVAGNNMAFLPFGMGPRFCVGQNCAMAEAKVALSMILQRYAFTVSPAYVHSPVRHLTIRPHHGLQLVLHKL